MWFLDRIVEYFIDISDLFYEAGLVAYDWVPPFWQLGTPLFAISDTFMWFAWRFTDFNEWVNSVEEKLLDLSPIDWIARIWEEIDDWWLYKKAVVRGWIADLEDWTVGELNSLSWFLQGLIADLENWTVGQLNTFRASILSLIDDIEAVTIGELNSLSLFLQSLIADVQNWAIGQLNTLRTLIYNLIANLEGWAIGQLNTLRTLIYNLIANVESWAIGELNSLRATISALDPWAMIQLSLTSWWGQRLIIIDSLAVTKLREWFPFYDELSELWSSVAEFFTDPEDWLYKAFDRIIERFW